MTLMIMHFEGKLNRDISAFSQQHDRTKTGN